MVISLDQIDERIENFQNEIVSLEEKIVVLRTKKERLEAMRRELMEEFGGAPEESLLGFPPNDPAESVIDGVRYIGRMDVRKPTRKEEIARFLLIHGASKRAKISDMTGIPDGTVAYEMRDRRIFCELRDKMWDVTEAIKQQAGSNPGKLRLPPTSRAS